MASTVKRQKANQKNAQKSTGPKSRAGKAAVSRNATRHGLLSTRLILGDENEAEYQDLLDGLCQSLRPVGLLEVVLVEKIAVNLWRQRRLVKAEQADIELSRLEKQVAKQVSEELRIGTFSPHRIKVDNLNGIEEYQVEWCKDVLTEYQLLTMEQMNDWSQLSSLAPLIHGQLLDDAESQDVSIEMYLNAHEGGLCEYLEELVDFCKGQVQYAIQFRVVQAVTELVTAARAIPSTEAREKLARYQTMLDNSLYKDMKALRDTQQWRLSVLDGPDDGRVFSSAATA